MQQDGTPDVPARAVFVDSSGRRGWLVRRVFWVLGAVMAAYVGVVILALAAPPDNESLRPLWALPLQQFFYRQLIYLVVLQSLVSALSGAHLPWHKLERSGQVTVPV